MQGIRHPIGKFADPRELGYRKPWFLARAMRGLEWVCGGWGGVRWWRCRFVWCSDRSFSWLFRKREPQPGDAIGGRKEKAPVAGPEGLICGLERAAAHGAIEGRHGAGSECTGVEGRCQGLGWGVGGGVRERYPGAPAPKPRNPAPTFFSWGPDFFGGFVGRGRRGMRRREEAG